MTRRPSKKKSWVTRKVIYTYIVNGQLKYGVHICHGKTDEEAEESCRKAVVWPHFVWRVVAEYY